MSLLKKTMVLSGQPPKGYLTALQIGTTAGLKLTLSSVRPNTLIAVRINGGAVQTFSVRALKEEFRLSSELTEKSQISAVVFLDSAIYAHTGNVPTIGYEDAATAQELVLDSQAILKNNFSDSVNNQKTQQNASIPYQDTQQNASIPYQDTQQNASIPHKNTQQNATASDKVTQQTAMASQKDAWQNDTRGYQSNPQSAASDSSVDAIKQNTSHAEQDKKSRQTTANSAEGTALYAEAEVVNDERAFRFFKKQAESHFYDRVRGRMDEMLTIHPREDELEHLIPDSKWVKVPYSEDEFYVVGTLSDGNRITHVGYGVKGIRSVLPPKEAENLSEFLPLDGDTGYWLMFQDADTGEMLLTE